MIPDAMNRLARHVSRATNVLILSREMGPDRINICVRCFDDYLEAWNEAHAWRASGWNHTAEIHCIDPHEDSVMNE